MYRSIRAHGMCEGGEKGGQGCESANDVVCAKCGDRRTVDDTSAPGECPCCGSRMYTVARCERCPVLELETVRAHSAAGRMFERVLQLEFDCKRFSVPWSDLSAEEVKGLQVLEEERDKYQREIAEDVDHVSPEEMRQLKLMQKYGKG